jgi:uncharacterized repeat protein (TIGR04076 family)
MPFRITVLKRASFDDLIQEYVPEPRKATYGPCERFEDGQVFEVRGGTPPASFCARAWASLFGDLAVVELGGNAPWINRKNTMITCCNDGLTPVVFRIERLIEDAA